MSLKSLRMSVGQDVAPHSDTHFAPSYERSCDLIVSGSGIGGQENLLPLELARRMLPAAHNRRQFGALGLAEFNPITYIHLCLRIDRGIDEQLNRMAGVSRSGKTFTPKQGQYLAFIYLYTRMHRRPPAKTDVQPKQLPELF
jgi:hypothetical protein